MVRVDVWSELIRWREATPIVWVMLKPTERVLAMCTRQK
jgi:hypothetical protein